MPIRTSRSVGVLAEIALSVVVLAAVTGCASRSAPADSDTDRLTGRAQLVAAAWDGSAAAAAWRAGYYPRGEAVQLPKGGPHSEADKLAFKERKFVLRGELPVDEPRNGQVMWTGGGSLARPLEGAVRSYERLADTHVDGRPHLTVTGAKPGRMTVITSRGSATVPAWLFSLDGYTTPLKRAAVLPSELPTSPIKAARDIPGHPLDRLVKITDHGRSVTVVALHGVCDDEAEVDVLETHGSVVLSAAVKGHGSGSTCTKQASLQQVTVELERPVGNRVLLDARTGRPVPYKGLDGISPP